jgi:transcriptional regulator with XRE-family HTH domain
VGRKDDLAEFLDEEIAADPTFALDLAEAAERHDLLVECVTARKRAGLSQTAVAREMNTTQSAVSEFEGGTDPRLSTLQRYARAVGSSIEVRLRPAPYLRVWHVDTMTQAFEVSGAMFVSGPTPSRPRPDLTLVRAA